MTRAVWRAGALHTGPAENLNRDLCTGTHRTMTRGWSIVSLRLEGC